LISQGAVPIVDDESFEDALAQIFGLPYDRTAEVSSPAQLASSHTRSDSIQDKALAALAQQPLRAEELLGICGDNVVEVIRYLTSLELKGLATRLRDGRYAADSLCD
jgi:DNA processing protein